MIALASQCGQSWKCGSCAMVRLGALATRLSNTILQENAALLKADRRVLFFCISFALCRYLCAPDLLNLRVPDLVDPVADLNCTLGSILALTDARATTTISDASARRMVYLRDEKSS